MRNSGKSFGFSGEQGVNTSKETGAISRDDGCKLTGAVFLALIVCVFGSAAPPVGNDFVAIAAGGSKSIA